MNLLIFNRKTSLKIILVLVLVTNFLTYYFVHKKELSNSQNNIEELKSELSNPNNSDYKIKRMKGFNYINPILFVDNIYESEDLNTIKQSVTTVIDNYKKMGILNSASFYIKEFNSNGWTGINTTEKFFPGSLMKIPLMVTILKMEELNPGFLNKEILNNQKYSYTTHQNYKSKSIAFGHKYSIRELLNYMIAYSDNDATTLLFINMDMVQYKKVFTDIGLTVPVMTSQNYPLTSREISYYMRMLYNATYLNQKNSEYATELLQKCNFNEGLKSGLPNSVKVAHKFGEAGDQNEQQLTETAIVYLNNYPYVLTIMTKGKDYKQLPQIAREISSIVYQNMVQKHDASAM
jgi:beta-lactamase class A